MTDTVPYASSGIAEGNEDCLPTEDDDPEEGIPSELNSIWEEHKDSKIGIEGLQYLAGYLAKKKGIFAHTCNWSIGC